MKANIRGLGLLAVLALCAVGVGLALTGGAAAEEVHNETMPGLNANETGNLTVELDWNSSANTSTDSATVYVDYVTDAANGTVAKTETVNVSASPGNWTITEVVLTPSQDVEEFDVQVNSTTFTASNTTYLAVDDVVLSEDWSGGGAVVGGDGGASTSSLVGAAILILVGAVVMIARDRDA